MMGPKEPELRGFEEQAAYPKQDPEEAPPQQRTSTRYGKNVLDHEGGTRFYHKHLSKKARAKKKARRKMKKRSR